MNKRSTMIVLAMSAMAISQAAGVNTINSVKVNERWWNDYPSSTVNTVNNYPALVTISDNPTSTGSGWANRHLIRFSNDGGATPFAFDGGNDTFEVSCQINVNSDGPTLGFPRRVEAGPWCRTPIIGFWYSEFQGIFTNDGEVAFFGAPIPFWSGSVQSSYFYTQGTTVSTGYRYFRDHADNKMKWIWFYGPHQSAPLTLESISGGEGTWDAGTYGFRPYGYTYTGTTVMPNELGFYFQIMPNNGGATTVNASVALSNFVVKEVGIKGMVDLMDITTSRLGEPVTVEIGAQTMNTILDHDGRFSFTGTNAPGTYTAYVKGRTHLRKMAAGVVVTADGANIGSLSLTNGDVDGDNEVGPGDFGQLSSAFGSVSGDGNWNANADLDRDGEVGPSDFGILSANFGESGD